jgi:hypothetical protein
MGYKMEKKHMGYDKRQYLVGGFNNLEKYYSQWEGLSHI